MSTSMGFALLDGHLNWETAPSLVERDIFVLPKTIVAYGPYPFCYLKAALKVRNKVVQLIKLHSPDVVVIEETNLGKNRYSQKVLEFIHCLVVEWLAKNFSGKTVYLSSSSWRHALRLGMNKDERKNNSTISEMKKASRSEDGKLDLAKFKQLKKASGIRGKITKKHVALRYVNELYGLKLKPKDNDQADAICLALAFLKNAVPCDGVL